jgi:hypothetical protein
MKYYSFLLLFFASTCAFAHQKIKTKRSIPPPPYVELADGSIKNVAFAKIKDRKIVTDSQVFSLQQVSSFSNGLKQFKKIEDNLWGIKDYDGKIAIYHAFFPVLSSGLHPTARKWWNTEGQKSPYYIEDANIKNYLLPLDYNNVGAIIPKTAPAYKYLYLPPKLTPTSKVFMLTGFGIVCIAGLIFYKGSTTYDIAGGLLAGSTGIMLFTHGLKQPKVRSGNILRAIDSYNGNNK